VLKRLSVPALGHFSTNPYTEFLDAGDCNGYYSIYYITFILVGKGGKEGKGLKNKGDFRSCFGRGFHLSAGIDA
jgi:hypothetical protein